MLSSICLKEFGIPFKFPLSHKYTDESESGAKTGMSDLNLSDLSWEQMIFIFPSFSLQADDARAESFHHNERFSSSLLTIFHSNILLIEWK